MSHPRGRQPIGVNQWPIGGSNYPFVKPSDDIKLLFGDLFLSYRDDACELSLPLRIAWLYGFGSNVVAAPGGYPTPTHAYDLLVLDADDNIVFDSTAADEFETSVWDSRLLILEWIGATAVCRAAIHTEFSPQQTPIVYDLYILPENGELDAKTLEIVPRRINSITVGADVLTGPIDIVGGYNAAFTLGATKSGDGVRRTTKLTLSLEAGGGLGRVPGCDDLPEPTLRRLNKIGPNEQGDFYLDLSGCYRSQLAVEVSGSPRSAAYAYPTFTDDEAKATLLLFNDCAPCCQCDDYVRTYKGLRKRWFEWVDLATDLEGSRDTFSQNIDRWNAQRDCRLDHSLNVALSTSAPCRIFAGAAYCNPSRCCLSPLELRFTFRYYERGVEVAPPAGGVCLQAFIEGVTTQGEELYTMGGSWPVVFAVFDRADPQTTSRIRFRVCVDDCGADQTVTATVTAHFPDPPPNAAEEICTIDAIAVPAEIEALWTTDPPQHAARAIATIAAPMTN